MKNKIFSLFNSIKQAFAPPVFPDDEDKTLRAKILSVLLLNMLLFLFLAILGTVFIFVNKLVSSIIISILFAFLLVSHLLLQRGRVLLASYLFSTENWILFILVVIFTGKITTAFAALLVASTIITGILVSSRYTITLTVLSSLITLGLAILENRGYSLPHPFPAGPLASWVVLALSFLLAYTPVKIAIERSSQSLARAWQSEKRYKTLFDEAPVMYLTAVDEQNIPIISNCNQLFLKTLGYQRDEVIGQPLDNFYTPEARTKMIEVGGYQRVAQGGDLFVERDLVAKDGQIIRTLLQAIPEIDKTGQTTNALVVYLDITQRKKVEETLYFLTQRSWEETGEDYFFAVAKYLGEILPVDYVVIDRVMDDKTARTLANFWLGKPRPNFEYALEDTPCGTIFGQRQCTYAENVQEEFPKDTDLVDMGAESYSGIPLWDSHGNPLGLIAVLERQPVKNISLVETILQIVASHVGHEIERQEAEAKLQDQLDKLRRWHDVTVGREGRVLDLKREVNELLVKSGKEPRYRDPKTK